MTSRPASYASREVPSSRTRQPVEVVPLGTILETVPRTIVPVLSASSCSRNSSLGRLKDAEAPSQIRTVMPSSSARSTIELTPSPQRDKSSLGASPGFLRPISSTPHIASNKDVLRPPVQQPSGMDRSILPTPAACSSLRNRPPSERAWFSPSRGGRFGVSNRPATERGRYFEPIVERPSQTSMLQSDSLSLHDARNAIRVARAADRDTRKIHFDEAEPDRAQMVAMVNSRTIYEPITRARQVRHPWRPSLVPNGNTISSTGSPLAVASPTSDPTARTSRTITVHPTLWEDELAVVLSIEVNGHPVARRVDIDWINCTNLLNAAGLSKGYRDVCLKGEKQRHIVRKGPACLKGVWLPLEPARKLAARHQVKDRVSPLFAADIVTPLMTPTNRFLTLQFLRACQERKILREDDLLTILSGRNSGSSTSDAGDGEFALLSRDAELAGLRRRKMDLLAFLAGLETAMKRAAASRQVIASRPSQTPKQTAKIVSDGGHRVQELPVVAEAEDESESNDDMLPGALSGLSDSPPRSLSQIASSQPDSYTRPRLSLSAVMNPTGDDATEAAWFDNATPVSDTGTSSVESETCSRRANVASSRVGQTFAEKQENHRRLEDSRSPSSTPPPRSLQMSSLGAVDPQTTTTSLASTSPRSPLWTAPTSRASSVPQGTLDAATLALESTWPMPPLFVRKWESSEWEDPRLSKRRKCDHGGHGTS